MPKRPAKVDYSNPSRAKKAQKYHVLKEKMEMLQKQVEELSDSSGSDCEDTVLPKKVVVQAQVHASSGGGTLLMTPTDDISFMKSVEADSPQRNVNFFDSDHLQVIDEDNSSQLETEEKDPRCFLDLFGLDPSTSNSQGEVMHEGIALRWSHIIRKGLAKEERETLIKQYPPAINCCALVPPILNDEIAINMDEYKLREDKYFQKLQSQMAAGLSALSNPVNSILSNSDDSHKSMMCRLADCAKIFGDVFYQLSMHRRFSVHTKLNPEYKKRIESQDIDEYLYGKDLMEKIKQIQASRSTSQAKIIMKPAQQIQAYGRNNRVANPGPKNFLSRSQFNRPKIRQLRERDNQESTTRQRGPRQAPPPQGRPARQNYTQTRRR